jgi:hypothetical protein
MDPSEPSRNQLGQTCHAISTGHGQLEAAPLPKDQQLQPLGGRKIQGGRKQRRAHGDEATSLFHDLPIEA